MGQKRILKKMANEKVWDKWMRENIPKLRGYS